MTEIAKTTPKDLIRLIRHKKKRAFLRAYAKTANINKASKAAEIDRRSHYFWLRTDEKYKEAFEYAEKQAADMLEDEAVRRATQGVRKLRFHKGEPIMVPDPDTGKMVPYVEHEYSDTLLIFLLKGSKPEKFVDRIEQRGKIEHEHKGGVAIYIPDNGRTIETTAEAKRIDHESD